MKMKKWFKCLLMTMALMMAVNVGTVSMTIPAAAKEKAAAETVKVGKKFWSGKFQYKVTSLKGDAGTAMLIGTKSKKLTSVNVPETVETGDYTLTVTEIGANAFRNCTKLKKVATNTSIKKIGKSAFSGCRKLAAVDIRSTELRSVGKDALKGISKQAVVTVPEGTETTYAKKLNVAVQAAAAETSETTSAVATPVAPAAETPAAPAAEIPAAPAAGTPETSAPAVETVGTEKVTEAAVETEAKVETEAVVETEAKVETEAVVETEAKVETEAVVETEAKAETEAVVETEARAETEAAVETEAKAETEAVVETEAKAETEAVVETEAKAETEAAVETEAKAETEAVVETEAKAETEAVVETEAKAETEAAVETEAETEAAPKAETESAPKMEAPVETVPDAEMSPKVSVPKAAPKKNASARKPASTKTTEPAAETEKAAEPATETEKATEPATGTEKVTEAATETEKATEAATETEKVTEAATETEEVTEAATEAEKVTEAATETEEVTEAEAETEEATEAEAETEEATETETETEHVCQFDWVVTKEPYCGYLGYDMTWRNTGTKVGTCEICGKTKTVGIRVDHEMELSRELEPTCTEAGKKEYKCAVCGYKKMESYGEPLGHQMEDREKPVTCTEDGCTYKECVRCGLVEDMKITASKTGHEFATENAAARAAGLPENAVVVREATCTRRGEIKYTCLHDDCGATKTQYIPATGHSYKEEKIPATCISDAKTVTTCTNAGCDYMKTEIEYGSRTDHKLVNELVKASTMTEHGYEIQECTNCNYKKEVILPLATHDHVWVHVTGGDGDREGVLASMSGGKIRTEKCTYEGCHDLRYTYHILGEDETCGDSENCSHWKPWEEVPCNGKGHSWKDGKCEVCGMTRPVNDNNDVTLKDVKDNEPHEVGQGASAAARIVWSVYVETHVNGVQVGAATQPTAISGSSKITLAAQPEKDGYTFTGWTWSRKEAMPETLFANSPDRLTLEISCEYMDVTFIANYGEATAQTPDVISVDPTQMPQVVHEHIDLSHIDLSETPSEDSAAEVYVDEAHLAQEYESILDESHGDEGSEVTMTIAE